MVSAATGDVHASCLCIYQVYCNHGNTNFQFTAIFCILVYDKGLSFGSIPLILSFNEGNRCVLMKRQCHNYFIYTFHIYS